MWSEEISEHKFPDKKSCFPVSTRSIPSLQSRSHGAAHICASSLSWLPAGKDSWTCWLPHIPRSCWEERCPQGCCGSLALSGRRGSRRCLGSSSAQLDPGLHSCCFHASSAIHSTVVLKSFSLSLWTWDVAGENCFFFPLSKQKTPGLFYLLLYIHNI